MLLGRLLPLSGALLLGACLLARDGTFREDGSGGSTATTGPGSTSSGDAVSTSTGQAGGSPSSEDCLNGIDDDGDGDVDCDDDDCGAAGFSCLPTAAGATGHLVLEGPCPEGSTERPARTCDAAQCDCTGTNGTCSFQVERWNGTQCNGPASSSVKTSAGCYVNTTATSAFRGVLSDDGNASCPSQAAAVPAGQVTRCDAVGGSCSGGGVCVPPSFPSANACVELAGDVACPPDFGGRRAVVFDDAQPTCACTCTNQGSSCEGTIDSWSEGSGCSGAPDNTVPIDGQCQMSGVVTYYRINPVVAVPLCEASAGPAAGATTICCR